MKATTEDATYTFTGLKDDTAYEVGYRVRDVAGNVTDLATEEVTTVKVDSNITLTPDEDDWTSGDVIVTIDWPETTLTTQIKVGDGEWQDYDEDTYTITENTTISARLTDGENNGETVELVIDNIDKDIKEYEWRINVMINGGEY